MRTFKRVAPIVVLLLLGLFGIASSYWVTMVQGSVIVTEEEETEEESVIEDEDIEIVEDEETDITDEEIQESL